MKEKFLAETAQQAGFKTAFIPTKDIVVNYDFRKFCEDNLCGKYGANYSCPPDCGTPQEVHEKLLSKNTAMVLQKICHINGYDDKETILKEKATINVLALDVMSKVKAAGYDCIPLGYGGCPVCNPCRRISNEPCAFPDKKISCLSAYCIDVAQLAKCCDLEFEWSQEKLYLFGMILFDN